MNTLIQKVSKMAIVFALCTGNPRSAWARGVRETAFDILENLECEYIPAEHDQLLAVVLDGARDFKEWAEGGCGLVYNYDICHRYCTPSEIVRYKDGEREPKGGWISIEALAGKQAFDLIFDHVLAVCDEYYRLFY